MVAVSAVSLSLISAGASSVMGPGSVSLYDQPVREDSHAALRAISWTPTSPPAATSSRVIEIVNHLPSGWWAGGAVKFVDKYTTSKMRFVSRCSGRAYRCITFRAGNTPGNNFGWSEGSTITVDPRLLAGSRNTSVYKRSILAHELGHQFGLSHSSGNNFMRTFNKGRPKFVATSAQKRALAKR